MKVIVRDSALADLDGIYAWIAKDNHVAAAIVVHRVFDSIDLLSLFPYVGRVSKIRAALQWPVPKLPYLIIYSIDEEFDELSIISVFHTAQNR